MNPPNPHPDADDIRARLEADTNSPEDADALLPALMRLRQIAPPETDPAQSAAKITALAGRLAAELPPRRAAWMPAYEHAYERVAEWWPLRLLRAQMRVVSREIWLASLLVIALGTLVTALRADPAAAGNANPLVIVAPLVAGIGVGFIYGPQVDPSLEIQLATPVSARLILLARLALVFGFNCVLGFAGSLTLNALHSEIALWPLVLSWLAPMAFLSALAFFLAVFSQESLLSGLVAFMIWVWQAVDFPFVRLPDMTTAEARPWLLALALLLSLSALALAGNDERWVRSGAQSN